MGPQIMVEEVLRVVGSLLKLIPFER
jgi:hypothetical protein